MPLDELNNLELTATTAAVDWPALDRILLGEARPTPASFPLHLLTGRWRAWVEAASRPFGSADYLAHCLLGGVAGVCNAGTRVGITSHWSEPLILWQALIGGPSSGKSAAFARVRALLDEVKPWEGSDVRAAISVLVDASLDDLNCALYSSPRGAVLWSSELADWMLDAQRRGERAAWLAACNAAPALVRTSQQACLPIGIAGALAPERLASFVEGDSALAARFLYAWPEAGLPSLGDEDTDDEGLVALLQKIANFAGHRETPCIVPLDEAATIRLEELMAQLRRRAGETDGVEAEWMTKGVPTIVRLAGLLSLMQWAEESQKEWAPVELGHIEAAHELWSTYYLPHAQSVFDRGGVAGCERAARRVTRWLKRMRASEISREDVRRQALCQTVNAEGAEDVLARLEAGGVLRQVEIATAGRTRRRWQVNPALADPFRTSR